MNRKSTEKVRQAAESVVGECPWCSLIIYGRLVFPRRCSRCGLVIEKAEEVTYGGLLAPPQKMQ